VRRGFDLAIDGLTEDDICSGQITFERRWRGYDPDQVDPLLRAAEQVAFSGSANLRRDMARRLRDADLQVVRRGYDRDAVDLYTQLLIDDYLLRDRAAPGCP
jgi:DivIVA domain-containing protein